MNDDDTRQGERALGRSISVRAFGDNADEIELDALDEARKFFGADVQLEVVRDYTATRVDHPSYLGIRAAGKDYSALVTVQERGVSS